MAASVAGRFRTIAQVMHRSQPNMSSIPNVVPAANVVPSASDYRDKLSGVQNSTITTNMAIASLSNPARLRKVIHHAKYNLYNFQGYATKPRGLFGFLGDGDRTFGSRDDTREREELELEPEEHNKLNDKNDKLVKVLGDNEAKDGSQVTEKAVDGGAKVATKALDSVGSILKTSFELELEVKLKELTITELALKDLGLVLVLKTKPQPEPDQPQK